MAERSTRVLADDWEGWPTRMKDSLSLKLLALSVVMSVVSPVARPALASASYANSGTVVSDKDMEDREVIEDVGDGGGAVSTEL